MNKYIVIAEYKSDTALVHETYLDHADYDTTFNRMKILEGSPQVIRVAMAELKYVTGNKSLLPESGDGNE